MVMETRFQEPGNSLKLTVLRRIFKKNSTDLAQWHKRGGTGTDPEPHVVSGFAFYKKKAADPQHQLLPI
jgi:hypothetical protein